MTQVHSVSVAPAWLTSDLCDLRTDSVLVPAAGTDI